MFGTVFSLLIAVLVLVGNKGMLRLLFGKVEDSVMESCVTYLKISAYSYPALAVYHSGAAVYRSLGKTSVTMYISVLSNIINVVGNVIGVFVLRAGVAGVAWPSLIARTFSAVAITVLCFRKKNEVFYAAGSIFNWDTDCLKRIWNVAIPNGVENGIFQLVKVALSSIVALFGTYQIAERLFLSYLLGIVLHMGVIGIAVAMVCDWVIRAVIFIWRQNSGKWKEFTVV